MRKFRGPLAASLFMIALGTAITGHSYQAQAHFMAAEAPLPRGAWRDGFNDVRTEQVPAVVRKFVIDAQGCGHFGGEYDPSNPPERNAFINKQMKKMRCDTLPERRRRLLAKYPKNAVVAAVIARVWEDYGFEE